LDFGFPIVLDFGFWYFVSLAFWYFSIILDFELWILKFICLGRPTPNIFVFRLIRIS